MKTHEKRKEWGIHKETNAQITAERDGKLVQRFWSHGIHMR